MPHASLADRIGRIAPLSNAERAALTEIEQRERHLRTGTTLIAEGERVTELAIVARGALAGRMTATEGWRRVTRLYLPGDLVSTGMLAMRESSETVVALTDAVIHRVDRATLGDVLTRHPRLALLLLADEQVERMALTDRLIAIETQPPHARLAALLIELRDRLRAVDPAISHSFVTPLTTEEMGEAIALRPAEAIRAMGKLGDLGLAVREAARITLVDERGLERLAARRDPRRGLDMTWLPKRA